MSKTLRQILDLAMERGIMQEHGLTGTTKEQELDIYEQQILQWVNDKVIQNSQDIDSATRQYSVEKEVRYEVQEEQRAILRESGWKETK